MATRDRTALFFRYREEARALHRRPSSSTENVVSDGGGDDALDHAEQGEMSRSRSRSLRRGGMEPDWLFTYNDLKGDFAELEKMLERLAALYAKHLLPSFGETDTSELEHEIRVSSSRLTKLLHAVEQKVRGISRQQDSSLSKQDVEAIIRRNIQKRYATPLQQFSMSFRKKQKAYLDKLKEQRETLSTADDSKFGVLVDVSNDVSHGGETNSFDPGFSESQLLEVENASALAQDRTRELNQVAANINDLAVLVKDIASLVVDQGTVLDRVDYNLEDVKLKTTSAVRELRIADRYQRKRHTLCCIIVLAIACGVMFMILVVKWTS